MIDGPEQAAAAVAATRFPPYGIRGVASATSRASGFGAQPGYLAHAHERVGVVVQIESRAALENVDAIAATNGVDAVFIGPADLAASLGHLGDPRKPEVQAAIDLAFRAITSAGKPAGIFALDRQDAKRRIVQGFKFVSVGTDIGLLASGARGLVHFFRAPGS
jgi:4-hydroxy-2-oxoheptanedioate aldolase